MEALAHLGLLLHGGKNKLRKVLVETAGLLSRIRPGTFRSIVRKSRTWTTISSNEVTGLRMLRQCNCPHNFCLQKYVSL